MAKTAYVPYLEKLQDVRWQEMRLRILDRDGWTCTRCEKKPKTLHVHHGYYEKGYDPWDYHPDTMMSLCPECHLICQDQLATLHKTIALYSNQYLVITYLTHQLF